MGLKQVPVADRLFTWPASEPQLIGSRCSSCSTIVFPAQRDCPRCGGDEVEEHLLARRGTLWTFTTQQFLPKEPYAGPGTEDDFDGYALGYIELPNEVMVEARLTERDPAKLEIGMEMELVVVPFTTDDQGNQVMTYAFAPVTGG
jgi:uncharacterized protein